MNSSKYLSPVASVAGFIVTASLLIGLIASIAYVYYQQRLSQEQSTVAVEEAHHVQMQAATLTDDLRHIAYTLSFLRDQLNLHNTLESTQDLVSFSQDLLSFLNSNELYDQIRLLDNSGMEIVRVNYNDGQPYLVPQVELQRKSDRDYFNLTSSLSPHQLYISPLDLNIEHGAVETPFKPVIRFAMPVFNMQGERMGVLVINHLASNMLDRFRRIASPTQSTPMLLNSEGYWLVHAEQAQEWGFMFDDRHDNNMTSRFPQLWKTITGVDHGQVEYEVGLVTFTSVRPFAEFKALQKLHPSSQVDMWNWKVVSMFPAQAMVTRMAPLRNRLMVSVLFASLLTILLLLFVVRSGKQRHGALEALYLHDRALDAVVSGIVICDMSLDEWPIIYCNSGFEQLTGYRREQVMGRSCCFLHENDQEQEGIATLQQSISNGEPCTVTVRNYRRDGSMFWSEVTISPVSDQLGTLTHYVAHLTDVSQRRQSENEREQLLQEVRRLSRGLMDVRELESKELVRCLHDDFGQMIAAIQLKVMLSKQLCQSQSYDETIAAIDEVHAMTGGLIDSVRGQLRKLRNGHLEAMGLVEAIRALISDWRHNADIEIIFSKHGLHGAISENSEIAVYRVVQESLTNIVRHAKASHVEIELHMTGGQLRLEITDNGCGFDVTITPSGMGLVGMRERIQAMDGLFQVISEPGIGTTVLCQLPEKQNEDYP